MAISCYFIITALVVSFLTSDENDVYNPKYCIDFSTIWPFRHSKICRKFLKLPPARSVEADEMKKLDEKNEINESFQNIK